MSEAMVKGEPQGTLRFSSGWPINPTQWFFRLGRLAGSFQEEEGREGGRREERVEVGGERGGWKRIYHRELILACCSPLCDEVSMMIFIMMLIVMQVKWWCTSVGKVQVHSRCSLSVGPTKLLSFFYCHFDYHYHHHNSSSSTTQCMLSIGVAHCRCCTRYSYYSRC